MAFRASNSKRCCRAAMNTPPSALSGCRRNRVGPICRTRPRVSASTILGAAVFGPPSLVLVQRNVLTRLCETFARRWGCQVTIDKLVGFHPTAPHPCGVHLSSTDGETTHKLPHRQLDSSKLDPAMFAKDCAQWIVNHHMSQEVIERDRARRDALKRQGFQDPVKRFPTNESTRKGNWTEILLAEYVQAAGSLSLPVYRLRYNPNVDQSMKGDDILAFDLDSDPVRVVVGEAKFRGKSSKAVVEEIVESLQKSHAGNIPASLQFVADRLYESGKVELGSKVAKCNELIALGKLSLGYIGLLVSDANAHWHVAANGQSTLTRLAVISLACACPEQLVIDAFAHAQESLK
jgi:hypothetical protein